MGLIRNDIRTASEGTLLAVGPAAAVCSESDLTDPSGSAILAPGRGSPPPARYVSRTPGTARTSSAQLQILVNELGGRESTAMTPQLRGHLLPRHHDAYTDRSGPPGVPEEVADVPLDELPTGAGAGYTRCQSCKQTWVFLSRRNGTPDPAARLGNGRWKQHSDAGRAAALEVLGGCQQTALQSEVPLDALAGVLEV